MQWFLYLISIVWIAVGSCSILYVSETREAARKLMNVNLKVMAALPLLAGILFILAASASAHSWFILVLGVLSFAKGGLMITNPKGIVDQATDWYLNRVSDQTYRFFGILTIILGTAILSWIV
jgi:hypothetical protein